MRSTVALTGIWVGSRSGVPRLLSVSTGVTKPAALICAWLLTMVPSAKGLMRRALTRTLAESPGARSPSFHCTTPALKTPPSSGCTSIKRGSMGSLTTTCLPTASPSLLTSMVKVSTSPGRTSPPLSSTKVLVALPKSIFEMTVSSVGSAMAVVCGSSESCGTPPLPLCSSLAWLAIGRPLSRLLPTLARKVTIAPSLGPTPITGISGQLSVRVVSSKLPPASAMTSTSVSGTTSLIRTFSALALPVLRTRSS